MSTFLFVLLLVLLVCIFVCVCLNMRACLCVSALSVCVCIYLCARVRWCLFVYFVTLCFYISLLLYIHFILIYLGTFLSVCVSVGLSVCLCVCLYVWMSVCLTLVGLFISLLRSLALGVTPHEVLRLGSQRRVRCQESSQNMVRQRWVLPPPLLCIVIHIWMSHVAPMNASCPTYKLVTYSGKSRTYEWVLPLWCLYTENKLFYKWT